MARNLEKYRIQVLCEDRTQYNFINSFLINQGVNGNRRINTCCDLPEGTQSGEQFVRENFVSNYCKYARGRENILLVVIQDIDKTNRTPDDAKNDLNMLVREAGMDAFTASDKILLVFPKRNIETWFEWLKKDPPRYEVSEEFDYKLCNKHPESSKLGKSAGDLYTKSLSDPSACENAPNSLIAACDEFNTLCEML